MLRDLSKHQYIPFPRRDETKVGSMERESIQEHDGDDTRTEEPQETPSWHTFVSNSPLSCTQKRD